MGLFSKLFDPTAGELKRLNRMVDQIDAFEEAHKQLTDAQLRAKTQEFRDRLQKGETLDQLLPEAFSVVREATFRVTGKRQFRVREEPEGPVFLLVDEIENLEQTPLLDKAYLATEKMIGWSYYVYVYDSVDEMRALLAQ